MKISMAQSLCAQHHRENKVFKLIIMLIVLGSLNKAFWEYKAKQTITTIIKGKGKLFMESCHQSHPCLPVKMYVKKTHN